VRGWFSDKAAAAWEQIFAALPGSPLHLCLGAYEVSDSILPNLKFRELKNKSSARNY
jgi:hypothetical protein